MKVLGQKLVKFCAHTHTRGSISSKDISVLMMVQTDCNANVGVIVGSLRGD